MEVGHFPGTLHALSLQPPEQSGEDHFNIFNMGHMTVQADDAGAGQEH